MKFKYQLLSLLIFFSPVIAETNNLDKTFLKITNNDLIVIFYN